MNIDGVVPLYLASAIRQGWKTVFNHDRGAIAEPIMTVPALLFENDVMRTSEKNMLYSLIASYDPSTGAHAWRVVHLAEAIASHLGLSREEIMLTGMAALLHDIGKTSLAASLVNKRGPLNHEEWKLMRLHPEIGQQILIMAGGIFASLAPMVVAHHERWDGLGYPACLIGEAIPIEARIIAVVDSFDAMTSFRPYRKPMTVAESCAELWRCAGSQYDPRVVSAFFAVLDTTGKQTESRLISTPYFTIAVPTFASSAISA